MSNEDSGNWFVLSVQTPASDGVILNSASLKQAEQSFTGSGLEVLEQAGYTPICDAQGNWIAFKLQAQVVPLSAPLTLQALAPFVPEGTVIVFDNGCLPSITWYFSAKGIQIIAD